MFHKEKEKSETTRRTFHLSYNLDNYVEIDDKLVTGVQDNN